MSNTGPVDIKLVSIRKYRMETNQAIGLF
jgi:hypothetical protein